MKKLKNDFYFVGTLRVFFFFRDTDTEVIVLQFISMAELVYHVILLKIWYSELLCDSPLTATVNDCRCELMIWCPVVKEWVVFCCYSIFLFRFHCMISFMKLREKTPIYGHAICSFATWITAGLVLVCSVLKTGAVVSYNVQLEEKKGNYSKPGWICGWLGFFKRIV